MANIFTLVLGIVKSFPDDVEVTMRYLKLYKTQIFGHLVYPDLIELVICTCEMTRKIFNSEYFKEIGDDPT